MDGGRSVRGWYSHRWDGEGIREEERSLEGKWRLSQRCVSTRRTKKIKEKSDEIQKIILWLKKVWEQCSQENNRFQTKTEAVWNREKEQGVVGILSIAHPQFSLQSCCFFTHGVPYLWTYAHTHTHTYTISLFTVCGKKPNSFMGFYEE